MQQKNNCILNKLIKKFKKIPEIKLTLKMLNNKKL